MELKSPLTFVEQVNRLRAHGMLIESDEEVLTFLKQVNYYRFTGYALEDRKNEHSSEFIQGTSFNRVRERYQFDVDMRHVLRKSLEIVEIYYRTEIAYVFSMLKCKESPHDQHYDVANYYMKTNFETLIKQVSKEENYYKESLIIRHHRRKYHNRMPLWVLVEVMTMSSLSKLYRCMYADDQTQIATAVGTTASLLKNHLHCLTILRNKFAHGARLYGTKFNPPVRFGRNFLKAHPEIKTDTLFGYIVMLAQSLPDERQKNELIENVIAITRKYEEALSLKQIGFPQLYAKVLKQL